MPSSEVADWSVPEQRQTHKLEAQPPAPLIDSVSSESSRRRHALDDVPGPGEMFLGFRIVRELGRGAYGRVLLAQQTELSDRLVALKVSTQLIGEVRKLARLQHTHIVPVYSVHEWHNLQALCMPYFGGTTLAHVLTEMRPQAEHLTTGKPLVSTIQGRSSSETGSTWTEPSSGTHLQHEPGPSHASETLQKLESMSYIDAILWFGSQLADGLAHAHERGLVHRDIKPANILLTDDGVPMLLDFNLADDSREPSLDRAKIGGTLPYMSPEQLAAFQDNATPIDGRSDIYSLGLILYQLLTRNYPFTYERGHRRERVSILLEERKAKKPTLQEFHEGISPAVEAIIQKCLKVDPNERYASARDLKEDLDRQLAHLPLKHIREPSQFERASKWCRRNPKLVSPASLIAFGAAIMLGFAAVTVSMSLDARAREQDRQRAQAVSDFDAFLNDFDRVKHVSVANAEQNAEVLRIGMAALDRYGVFEPGWQDRPNVQLLSAQRRAHLNGHIGELSFILSRATIVAKLPDHREQLDRLAELIRADGAEPTDYIQAFDLASKGEFRSALPLINGFVQRHPDDFGAWFLKAQIHQQLDQTEQALAGYGTCIALRPTFARTYMDRAILLYQQSNLPEQAKADLDRALELEPDFLDARLNRAIVLRSLRKYELALSDLNKLLKQEMVPTRVWFLRSHVRDAAGDKEGAKADRAEGLKREPTDPVSWLARGMARAADDPNAALADFEKAESISPRYADALVNQAWILGEKLHRPHDALKVTERLLVWRPDHRNMRAGRAVLLARVGRSAEAIAEARKCLDATTHASILYKIGCVFALVSDKEPKYRPEAVQLIAKALLCGYGYEQILRDPDLDPLRNDQVFLHIANGVKMMRAVNGR